MNSAEEYILRHTDPEWPWLARLDRDANVQLMNPRMNSGHIQGRFLKMLTQLVSPRLALEIGTYAGYAAQCIAEGLPQDGKIITIEKDDELEDFINEHLKPSPYLSKIELIIGDALEVLPRLESRYGEKSFGLIYIDADKRLYKQFYELSLRLLSPNGIMIADNVLWDGHVTESCRSDRMTDGIREFNDMVAADGRVEKLMLPLRDGIMLIKKKDGC